MSYPLLVSSQKASENVKKLAGARPSSEPMMFSLLMRICVTHPHELKKQNIKFMVITLPALFFAGALASMLVTNYGSAYIPHLRGLTINSFTPNNAKYLLKDPPSHSCMSSISF